jgi:putative molybdenum carrier protein
MKIFSGGQTGVDRAALDVAIERGLPWGGWCPKGGWAEDFPGAPGLLSKYPHLRETPLAHPRQRTEWNVRDCDAALIVVDGLGVAISIGTRRGQQWAQQHGNGRIFDAWSDDDLASNFDNGQGA